MSWDNFTATLAITVALVAAAVSGERPETSDATCNHAGWYYYGGHCYLVDPVGTEPMAWQTALDFCPVANESEFQVKLSVALRRLYAFVLH